MFYVIKDEILYEFADTIDVFDYPDEAKELQGVTLFEFQMNKDKYRIENGVLVDISQTDEYLAKTAAAEKEAAQQEIQKQLDALDLKCIRAMREGGNDTDGVPFLDKYQAQINELRAQYNSL